MLIIFHRFNVETLLYLRNSLLEQKQSFVIEASNTGKHKYSKVQVKLTKKLN